MKRGETDAVAGCLALVGAVAVAPALLVVFAAWEGWVLRILWGWFVSPALGVGPLALSHAIGFTLIVGMVVASPRHYEGHVIDNVRTWVAGILAPGVALAAGWLVKLAA